MRISKLKIPITETKKVSLKEINLTKKPLGSTIALVGKNGAGKSRVLKFVETYLRNLTYEAFFDDHFQNIPAIINSQYLRHIESARSQFRQLKNKNPIAPQTQQLRQQLDQTLAPLIQRFKQLGQAYIKVVDNDDLKNIKTDINDNDSLTFEKILTNSHFDNIVANPSLVQQVRSGADNQYGVLLNEFNVFNNHTTVDYLKKITNEIVTDEFNLYIKNRTKPNVIVDEIKEKKSFQLFDKFQKYVRQFLGKDFSYQQVAQGNTVNSTLYFNNEPFNLTQLSPGQKTLFAYAILFFYLDINSNANIRESIIIIDEPEKHLHPEAQITLINALKSIVGKTGQLWIATHSVHILSHLDYDEIMMVKDDEIFPPSRTTPGKSFNDLMGLEEHIDELITFINSISQWAYGNFMVQCFKEPEVIFGKSINDPQFKLFKEFLVDRRNLNVLDFGAGKGRIGFTILEDEVVASKVVYNAFEPDKGNLESLNSIPNKNIVYYILDEIPLNSFDCIILCNVLHEISPREWVKTLSSIRNLLRNDGFLIIIEDRFLPKGETSHEFGYLIFGEEEMKLLLGSSGSINLKLEDVEFKERIIFTAFKKDEINPNNDSVIQAIKALRTNSFNNLKILKKGTKDLNQGRRYANETQLYINSQLALESLER